MRSKHKALLLIFSGMMVLVPSLSTQAKDCGNERSTYVANKNVVFADALIACLDGVTAGGAANISAGWTPTPFIGNGPKPKGPNYHEMQEYLQWVQDQYDLTQDEWTNVFSSALPSDVQVYRLDSSPNAKLQILQRGDQLQWQTQVPSIRPMFEVPNRAIDLQDFNLNNFNSMPARQ